MPKLTVDVVANTLKKHQVAPQTLRAVVEDLKALRDPKAEKAPAVKKEYAILLSDPAGKIPKDSHFVGWVLQLPDDTSVAPVLESVTGRLRL